MRIKSYLLCLAIAGLLLFPACKKTNNGHLVKSFTSPISVLCYGCFSPVTINYDYDNLGRIIKSSRGNETWQYLPGLVLISQDTCFLNNQGLAIRYSGSSYIFAYDSSGYLISDSVPPYSGVASLYRKNTISNGNTIKAVDDSAGVFVDSIVYTFYTNLDTRQWGMAYTGMQNTNLIKTATTYTSSAPASVVGYTYTFDGEGRVVQEIHTPPGANVQGTYSYTY